MTTRQLGHDGPHLTTVGFGAWAIGGPWIYGWGSVDDNESIRAIHCALDSGINWIDTAAAYGFGHSEEVVARALKGRKAFVATKCGLVSDGKGGTKNDVTPAGIRAEAQASLRRLAVDCIDLYQIHWPGTGEAIEEAWGEMVRLREEGKVRYIGVSNFDVPLLRRCMKIAPVQSLQPPYSLLNRSVDREILPFCRENGIGVIAYSPMQSGLLTGRFDVARLAQDDWRRKSPLYREPALSNIMAFVNALGPIAGRKGVTTGQLAVAWVLHHPAVTAAIVGARSADQVKENVGAAMSALTSAERDELTALVERMVPPGS